MPVSPNKVLEILLGSTRKSKSPLIRELNDILNDKTINEKAKFRLSIRDYTKMCDNDELRAMMTNKLKTNIDDLTEFCIRVKGVGEHIDLSEKIINKKINPPKISILDIPMEVIKENIVEEQYISLLKYKLVDFIKDTKFNGQPLEARLKEYSNSLSANPNAIDYIQDKDNGIKEIAYDYLSQNTNPKALPLLVERIREENKLKAKVLKKIENRINWESLWANKNVFELFELLKKDTELSVLALDKLENPNYLGLSANPSDKALDILEKKERKINWGNLSGNTNPRAFKLLKANESNINWGELSGNSSPEAFKLLMANESKIKWDKLSGNSSDKALDILLSNKSKINYGELSGNTNPRAIGYLLTEEQFRKIYWAKLAANPSIFIQI